MFNNVNVVSIFIDRAARLKTGPLSMTKRSKRPAPTANRRIYTAGDICLKCKFTHLADATARIVIQNALFGGRKNLSALAAVIHPYPTQAEAIRQTSDLYNRARLTPFVKQLFARFLACRR